MFGLMTSVCAFSHLTSLSFSSGNSGDLVIIVIDETLPRAFSATGGREFSYKGVDSWPLCCEVMGCVPVAGYALEALSPGMRLHKSQELQTR